MRSKPMILVALLPEPKPKRSPHSGPLARRSHEARSWPATCTQGQHSPAPASDVMMSLTERESQALGSIAHGLAGSDPRLASIQDLHPVDGRRAPRPPSHGMPARPS